MQLRDSNLKLALKNLFLSKRENCIVLEPHMGLGDALINLSLVKVIATQSPSSIFYYSCLPNYYQSVAWMLRDLNNVFPLVVASGREARQYAQFKNAQYFPIGVVNVDIKKFDESFYAQHQVPFYLRWALSSTPPGPNSQELFYRLNPKNLPFILVCKQDSSGHIHDLNIANPLNLSTIEVRPLTNNIFDWAHLLSKATEIHTIDTAFIHFVENTLSADTKQKLLFHRIRQSPTEFTRRLPWHEIHY